MTQKLMQLAEVRKATLISKATIYRKMEEGTFPRPLKLSANRVAWRESEIMEWIDSLPVSEGLSIR